MGAMTPRLAPDADAEGAAHHHLVLAQRGKGTFFSFLSQNFFPLQARKTLWFWAMPTGLSLTLIVVAN
jgi:hypothetical protein